MRIAILADTGFCHTIRWYRELSARGRAGRKSAEEQLDFTRCPDQREERYREVLRTS